MDITACRKAIANQITAVVPAPLTATWYVPDMPTEPHVWLKPADIDYDRAHRNAGTNLGGGLEIINFDAVLVCSRADDQASQLTLDKYLHGNGALSIKAAIENGRQQYGGSAYLGIFDDCWVSSVSSYNWYVAGDARFLGATYKLMVIGRGDI